MASTGWGRGAHQWDIEKGGRFTFIPQYTYLTSTHTLQGLDLPFFSDLFSLDSRAFKSKCCSDS